MNYLVFFCLKQIFTYQKRESYFSNKCRSSLLLSLSSPQELMVLCSHSPLSVCKDVFMNVFLLHAFWGTVAADLAATNCS